MEGVCMLSERRAAVAVKGDTGACCCGTDWGGRLSCGAGVRLLAGGR